MKQIFDLLQRQRETDMAKSEHRGVGIAGRLLLSFAGVAMLSLASVGIGWLILRNIETAQQTIVGQALPAVADAESLARLSAQIIAGGSLVTRATTEEGRRLQSANLARRAEELRGVLKRIEGYDFESAQIKILRSGVGELLRNLDQQDGLVADIRLCMCGVHLEHHQS